MPDESQVKCEYGFLEVCLLAIDKHNKKPIAMASCNEGLPMAKMIKQNWSAIALLAVFIVLVGSWNLVPHWIRGTVQGDDSSSAQGQSQSESATLVTAAHSRIQLLRQRLALTNSDLASLGCSQETAERVLSKVVAWEHDHRETLEQRRSVLRQSEASLREAQRRINIGPRDAGVIAQLPQLEREVNAAKLQEAQLLDQLAMQVQIIFDQDQLALWQAARAALASGLPAGSRYQFAGALSAEKVAALETAVRRSQRSSSGAGHPNGDPSAIAEVQALNAAQRQAVAAARSNSQRTIEAVIAAERKVLTSVDVE